MDSSKIKAVLIAIVAMFCAIYLGIAAATDKFAAIAWIVGIGGIAILLALGKNVWALIPIALMLSGGINAIPGCPLPWWIATAAAGTMLLLRLLTRKTDTFIFRLTGLDFAIGLQVIAIAQAFVRNPTGLSLLGGATVGGKSYIIYTIAFIAYATLSVMQCDIKKFRIVVIFMITVACLDGLLMIATSLSPQVAAFTITLYSAADFNAAQGMEIDVTESRLGAGQDLARTLGLVAFTLFAPLSTCNPLHPVRFTMMLSSVFICLLSGFRSALGALIIFFVVGTLVRKRYGDLVIGLAAAMIGLAFLIGSGSVRTLPFGAQRILSVLPFIDVEDTARKNAEDSSEWRFEMWRLALTTDRYIKNKYLGDGFGYSADELRAALDSAMGDHRMLGQANQQDVMLAKGSYHGFHVEAIRFTGVFGLVTALVSLGIFFRYSLKQIRHFRGRPEWGFVLFICVPFLIHPFYYMLIFASYKNAFPALLAMAGMLKVLDNIRVRELAAARAATPTPEPSHVPFRSLPSDRFPRPAVKNI
jgi:hypothetical protein